jgi:hypothetical protein
LTELIQYENLIYIWHIINNPLGSTGQAYEQKFDPFIDCRFTHFHDELQWFWH